MFKMKQVRSRRSVQRRTACVNQILLFDGLLHTAAARYCGCPDQSGRAGLACLTLPSGPAKLSRDAAKQVVPVSKESQSVLSRVRIEQSTN